jgi:hypothetical protein
MTTKRHLFNKEQEIEQSFPESNVVVFLLVDCYSSAIRTDGGGIPASGTGGR